LAKIISPILGNVLVYPLSDILRAVSGEEIIYLLRDEFTTALAAGSINGTNADPGPGVRTVMDTANHLSITGGNLVADGAAGLGDPSMSIGAITRVPGLMSIIQQTRTAGQIRNGFHTAATGLLTAAGFRLWATANQIDLVDNAAGPGIGNFTTATSYKYATILRAAGCVLLVKGGTEYPQWTLLYISAINSTATLYPIEVSAAAGAFTSSFLRIPTTLWLPTPLLSDGFGSTFGISDGLGHAEGIAGGLGAGGGGKVWTDAGTWATAAGVAACTPVEGDEVVIDGGFDDDSKWISVDSWTVAGSVATKEASGTVRSLTNVGSTTIVRQWYKQTADLVISAGGMLLGWHSSIDLGIYVGTGAYLRTARCTAAGAPRIFGQTNAAGTVNNFVTKPLPISTLITNQVLTTTDVLAEEVISTYTLGTQAGIVQADRSFAAKAANTAAAGQAVLSLKEVTGVGGVGLAVTDGITVNGTVYTIASVTGGSNVAYDDVAKTQTITLGANLGAEVLVGAKVGLDWASWNGSLHYFDGVGNIKVDEVLAGVYTNRGITAKAFSVDARLIIRKVGSEYRIFYGEALIGTAISTVATEAYSNAFYWGMFSTLPTNTISSFCVYDTGNVTNTYSILDKYSKE